VNALWPKTVIDTAAVRNLLGGTEVSNLGRKAEIMADSAYAIFMKDVNYTGKFCIDEDVLRAEGLSEADLEKYSVVPGSKLAPDFFV
jgi:citronellol/citronellal dehydrogenase